MAHPRSLPAVLLGVLLGVSAGTAGWTTGGGGNAASPTPAKGNSFRPDTLVTGRWGGTLEVNPGVRLPLVFHLAEDAEGLLGGTMDSPAQGATDIPIPEVAWDGTTLRLGLPALGARFEGTLTPGGTIEGEWHQGAASLPLTLTPVVGEAGPRRPQHPVPPFPYRQEEVHFPNALEGIQLAGTLTLPDPAEVPGPYPAVILLTGSGPQDRDEAILGHRPFLVLADHLTRRGVAVLRFDDRGVGASEGNFAAATSLDFAGDGAAALEWLRSHPEVDAARIGFAGHSEGGILIPMIAGGLPGHPSHPMAFAVLLAAPALPGGEILMLQAEAIARAAGVDEEEVEVILDFQRRMQAAIREDGDPGARIHRLEEVLRDALARMDPGDRERQGIPSGQEDAWVQAQLNAVGSDWYRTFVMHDPRPPLRSFQVPVLALFGGKDLQVPAGENRLEMERALEDAGNPDVSLEVLPDLNHLFQTAPTGAPSEYALLEETFAPVALERIAEWILARVGADP